MTNFVKKLGAVICSVVVVIIIGLTFLLPWWGIDMTIDFSAGQDVLGISEGQVYPAGTNLPISFAFENSSGVVDLRLYTGNIPVVGGIIANDFDTQNGTVPFMWTVNDYGHPGPSYTAYNVVAFDSNDDNCIGESGHFTIPQ